MNEAGLVAEIEALIDRGFDEPPGEAAFDRLARAIFTFQFERVAPYRRLCQARRRTPDSVLSWREVPLVPTSAFKDAVLSAVEPERAERIFETSGTSVGRPGRHVVADTRLYRRALGPTFRRHVVPDRDRMRMGILAPTGREAPASSLSFMLDALAVEFGRPGTGFLEVEGLERFLAAADEPVLLFGTSFAFVHAIDAIRPVSLPPGSRIVDTGGTKGRSREVSRPDLVAAFEAVFGVPASHVLSEYGMTELSSQFYDRHLAQGGPPGVKAGGPWARVRILDPVTLAERPAGEPGLIAVFDALNLWSVSAILTGDLGVARPGGFEVLGRAPGAAPRGCSIAADERFSR